MLFSLRRKCAQLEGPQQDVMRLMLVLIQRRVTFLGGTPATQTLQSMSLLLLRLRKFRIGLLLDLLQNCHQVDATLKSELKALRSNARAVHSPM
eukprot:Skav210196  [mRNA]  locus=scaffold1264:30537:30818:- [translate_table: standard]